MSSASRAAPPDEPTRVMGRRVTSSNFRDQAVGILRDQILSGEYESGRRLNEVEIAAEMGISRGPLREALQRLVVEGLVEVIPHRGAVVRSFTLVELRQMYEFREIVEAGAARLAAVRASKAQVEALRSMLTETGLLIAIEPTMAYPASPDFHREILGLSANLSLIQAGTELQTQLKIARRDSAKNPGRALAAHEEHCAIVEAIAQGDPEGAAALMAHHLAKSLSSVSGHIKELDTDSGGTK